jgi:hypothetical protein
MSAREIGGVAVKAASKRETPCTCVQGVGMTPRGSELPPFPTGKTKVSGSGGSNSGNKDARLGDSSGVVTPPQPTDPDLSRLVAAWPDLPPAIRAGIVAMVNAAGPEGA